MLENFHVHNVLPLSRFNLYPVPVGHEIHWQITATSNSIVFTLHHKNYWTHHSGFFTFISVTVQTR